MTWASGTRAALYVRKSTDREATRAGVEQQEQDGRYLCERNGCSDITLYSDNAKTAADPAKPRPEYERMMADIRAGLVDVVVVTVSDRLHRQPAELEQFIADASAARMTQVATMRADFDLTDSECRYRMRDETNRARLEVDRTSDRVKRRKQQHAAKGLPNGGGRPFGYLGTDKVAGRKGGMELDETEAELIREAATRLLDGASLTSIRDDWTARGVATVTGARWSLKTLTKLLTSSRIAGLRQHEVNGEVTEYPAAWPAIIDEATRAALVALLTSRRRPPASNTYPLRGVLRCALCGSNLVARPYRGRRHYQCRKDAGGCGKVIVSADAIERYLEDTLLPIADSPELADFVAAEEGHDRAERDELLKTIKTEQAKLAGFEDDYAEGNITGAQLRKATAAATERLSAAEGRLASLRGSTVLGRLGGNVVATWADLSAEDKRTIWLSLCRWVNVRQAARDADGVYHGGNVFDTSRVSIVGRFAAQAKLFEGVDAPAFELYATEEEADAAVG